MSKVKVSAVEAKELEWITAHGDTERCIKEYIEYGHTWNKYLKPLKDMGFDKFVAAVVNGWEVEKTPHEKVKEYYDNQASLADHHRNTSLVTISHILLHLGIKIDGINA
ncbi:hypothetical protein [Paenibacillus sp. OV219]|uniref:hypothetical protein n=1 Tax=Paenibacillus sp. OV219 TaxID=1884377 RepID=UPI000B848327|nr:hypothetical protein [Paenibacillus sp. OV219]